MRILLFVVWGITATCALPRGLISSVFELQYTPSASLLEAEIAVLEEATLSVLQEALLLDGDFLVNQTQVVFQLQDSDQQDTLNFRASAVSASADQSVWQAFVETTLLANTDKVFDTAVKSSELWFLTSISMEAVGNDPRKRIFTRLDWILLAVSLVLFGIFVYLMYLNYRDWKNDRPPRNIEEKEHLDPLQKPSIQEVEEKADDKELNEIIERFTLTSEANTSPTSSTNERPASPEPNKPYRCTDQDACSLEAALSGLSDIVHNVMRPQDQENTSLDGTMPSHGTSDVFDTIEDRTPSNAAEWMKHVRISVLESSSSLASRDSLKHAMVDASSSIYSGSELDGSDQS